MAAAPWPSTHWAVPAHQQRAASIHGRTQCSTPPEAPGLGALAAAAALRGACPPLQPAGLAQQLPMGLPQQLAAAGQQRAAEQRRRRGCSRCIACIPHLRSYSHSLAALAARSRGSLPLHGPIEDGELWPGGLSSPSLYLAIRARQLQQQCRALNNAAAASLWRSAVEAPAQLLVQRGSPPLRVKVPAAFTNIAPGDKCELVAIKDVVLCRPSPLAATSAPQAAKPASQSRAAPPCLPSKAAAAPAFPASGSLPMPVTPEEAPLCPRVPSPAVPLAAPARPATAVSAAAARLATQLLVQAQQQPYAVLPAAANPSKRSNSSVQPVETKRARMSDSFPALSPLLPALQLTPELDSGKSCETAPFMFSPRGTAALHCGSLASSAGGSSLSSSSSAASLVGEQSINTVLPLVPLHPPAFFSRAPSTAPAAADQGHYLAIAQQRAATRAFTVVAIEPPTAPPASASLASIFARWLCRSES